MKKQTLLVSYSGELGNDLEKIRKELGKTKQDIFRFALSLYVDIYNKSLKGYEFSLVKNNKGANLYMPGFLPEVDNNEELYEKENVSKLNGEEASNQFGFKDVLVSNEE